MPSQSPIVLDCTLRDGGYYTDWDYPEGFVSAYVDAMDRASVDRIELGYRSLGYSKFVGALGFCADWVLERLPPVRHAKFGVMLDAKEFVGRAERVSELFQPRNQSRLEFVRVATSYAHLDLGLELAARLSDLGYLTTINLMAVATLDEARRASAFQRLGESVTDVVYVADSFGSMYPNDIRRCSEQLKECSSKPWGVHLHNNLELAFANALSAMELGATWIDSSVMGMGRGPGNLRTELFMQHLAARGRANATDPIYEFISRHVVALHDRHRWGPSPAYVLSGFLGAHPSYAQSLLTTGRYSIGEVVKVLRTVHRSGRASHFDAKTLHNALSKRHGEHPASSSVDGAQPRGGACPWDERSVLIVGRGPSTTQHAAAINEYIRRTDPIVLECNHIAEIEKATHHFCAFAVLENARTMMGAVAAAGKAAIIPSRAYLPAGCLVAVLEQPFAVRQGSLEIGASGDPLLIPADVVSMLAIATAVRRGARHIEVVGFDGYADSLHERDRRMQSEMVAFLELLREQRPELKLRSLTRTGFELEESSIYGLLAAT